MARTKMILNGSEVRKALNFKTTITTESTIVFHKEKKTVHIVPVNPNIKNNAMSKYIVTLTTE